MKITKENLGGTYIIKDVPKNDPCLDCNGCMRLRLLELGFIPGTKVIINNHYNGLWLMRFLTSDGNVESTMALRDEELDRIIFEDDCFITLGQID